MPVLLPDELLLATHLTEGELKTELAVALFQRDRLTLAQAARLSTLSQLAFQQLLAERRIPLHYTEEDLEQDLRRARNSLGRM